MTLPWPPLGPDTGHDFTGMARASLARLINSVAVASGLAATGRQVDLSGLDSDAGLLCAQVMDLDRDDGIAMRPALVALNEQLALLEDSVQSRMTPPPPADLRRRS